MTDLDSPPEQSGWRWAAVLFAIAVATFGFLPVVDWVNGGYSAPWFRAVVAEWTSGSAIVVGGAVVLAVVSRRVAGLWRPGAIDPLVDWAHRRPVLFGVLAAAGACTLYAVVAWRVFSRVPISVDELVQLVQARTFASGRLWRPAAPEPEFYSILNMVDAGGRYYSQFPPGGPAMLAVGVLAGAPWLVGPVCGGASVGAFWAYVRAAEPRRGVAVGAVVLFALAPFAVFMSGSHMNHVPTLMWLVVAMAAFARVVTTDRPRPWVGFLHGLALGCAATIRPVDALAFAVPAAGWYLVAALGSQRRWREAMASALGVALPLGALMVVNARTTGAPLLFGYQVLWGHSHDLGFHRAPWGLAHTPARGLELVSLYYLRLQTYLFETPLPSLAPALVALFLVRRLERLDRVLLASAVLVTALYFAYWHDGFLFGPRFMYPLLPLFALWTARVPTLVRERFGAGFVYRASWYAFGVAAVVAVAVSVPQRVREYAASFVPMRLDYLAPARQGRVDGALIFVRESWGTQVMARLWALGVPRSEAELLYAKVDACALEQGIEVLERSDVRSVAAFHALTPLLADSGAVVKSPFSPDVTERYLPGRAYAPVCAERIGEDRLGFTLLAPLLYRDWGSNVYARDMHGRNIALWRRYPTRPMYLLRPAGNATGAPLQLLPLPLDSVLRAWGANSE